MNLDYLIFQLVTSRVLAGTAFAFCAYLLDLNRIAIFGAFVAGFFMMAGLTIGLKENDNTKSKK